ncbi:MAG: isochorismatase family protein [Burkholderiales bacterium]|nr:isochorismatase family protein [Burkholderiales bacterium]
MLITSNNAVLVMIDLQKRLMPAIDEGQSVIEQCLQLGQVAQLLHVPIIGTEQNPASLGDNLPEIKALCQTTISKTYFDACHDGLLIELGKFNPARQQIILVGCETHVCVLQTVFGLIFNQYQVTIVIDALGSRHTLDKEIAIERMEKAGAKLVTSEMLIFEWLQTSNRPEFKAILKIIK